MGGIVVIGGGQAGASLVGKLRAEGFEGAVTLVCAENVPPYQRPPLSKKYLMGEMEAERLFLRPETFYAEHGIDLILGRTVGAVDPAGRTVTFTDGGQLGYDLLALTTGSVPRRLPAPIGGDLGGVHTVRTLADIDAMVPDIVPGARVLIVGGGYIGLEAAAVAATKGLDVTLVEMSARILQRVACAETSDYFRSLHEAHGVRVLEGTGLERLVGDGRVTGAILSTGERLDLDTVIVGVGITPETALAEAAGLEIENGISTDALGRTSDPAIFAAGDCASFPWRGGRQRLESVQNAIDQAECVAVNMTGGNQAYDPEPWFWSDQYDTKLQIAGLNTGYDRVIVRPGDRDGAVSHWYYGDKTLLAVDAMNDPRAYMIGKRLIEAGRSPRSDVLADPETDLKALLSQ